MEVAAGLVVLPDWDQALRVAVRLALAAVLGGGLGFERERRRRAAGLRTHMLVSLGAAIFVVSSMESGVSPGDLTRVIQGIAAGIGFVGAGAILKNARRGEVQGLTTAASVWLTAAVGVAAGAGQVATAVLGAALALGVMAWLGRLENRDPER